MGTHEMRQSLVSRPGYFTTLPNEWQSPHTILIRNKTRAGKLDIARNDQ